MNAATGVFTYTPTAAARHAAAATGASSTVKSDTVTVTVNDGHGGVASKAVTVAIAPANPDSALLAAVNDARLHPQKYPPHGDATGAIMTACACAFNNSADLTDTASSHNTHLAELPLDEANRDPHVTRPAKNHHQWDGRTPNKPTDRSQKGYKSWRAEIVAIGQRSEAEAVQFWMQDDAAFGWGHRNAILRCETTDAGAAHLAGGPGGNYWTVDLGTH